MLLKIACIGQDETVCFAQAECVRYLARMVPAAQIIPLAERAYDRQRADVLWIGEASAFAEALPPVDDPALDDAICLRVEGGCGVVAGGNPRSVLIAVYRLLRENGCLFLRPGDERVPTRAMAAIRAQVLERASYRHRGVCIEGADSYQNALDMIDWLPKMGMNAYFMQFIAPSAFFARWYEHHNNPDVPAEALTRADVLGMRGALEREIRLRGLMYHAVGHGWTCEPFGIPGETWDAGDIAVPADAVPHLAQVNGVRALSGGIPLDTNLCYGNPETRARMVDYAVAYLRAHPGIDYLHFWLGDNMNNHCECPRCRDTVPSDFYVMLLNELDERLTQAGIATRVVFLAYIDLLWPPKEQRLQNPGRFVLMFAPITRTYTRPFLPDAPFAGELAPYRRNQNVMPEDVAENVARLAQWRAVFDGDSFDFDYHMMYDHHRDAGGYEMARVLATDIRNLREIGLNGLISCQNQRAAFPTGLGEFVMARTLWNRDEDFGALAQAFFEAAFGADGALVQAYLRGLSELLAPAYLRFEMPAQDEETALAFERAIAQIDAFLPVIDGRLDTPHRADWAALRLHAGLAARFARALVHRARGEEAAMRAAWDETARYARAIEPDVQSAFDAYEYIKTLRPFIERSSGPIF